MEYLTPFVTFSTASRAAAAPTMTPTSDMWMGCPPSSLSTFGKRKNPNLGKHGGASGAPLPAGSGVLMHTTEDWEQQERCSCHCGGSAHHCAGGLCCHTEAFAAGEAASVEVHGGQWLHARDRIHLNPNVQCHSRKLKNARVSRGWSPKVWAETASLKVSGVGTDQVPTKYNSLGGVFVKLKCERILPQVDAVSPSLPQELGWALDEEHQALSEGEVAE
eukprot:5497403-Amphidinium_carterae.7